MGITAYLRKWSNKTKKQVDDITFTSSYTCKGCGAPVTSIKCNYCGSYYDIYDPRKSRKLYTF